MAEQLNMKRNTYRNIEKGNTALISTRLEEIAEILNTSTTGLLLGDFDLEQDFSNRLSDVKTEYRSRYEIKESELENKIELLEKKNAELESRIKELEDRISDKEQIIQFLKSRQ